MKKCHKPSLHPLSSSQVTCNGERNVPYSERLMLCSSETRHSHARGQQSNLWWISSNWKSPVLRVPDSEKNNSHQQEEETMSDVTAEERAGKHMFNSWIVTVKQKVWFVRLEQLTRSYEAVWLHPRCTICPETQRHNADLPRERIHGGRALTVSFGKSWRLDSRVQMCDSTPTRDRTWTSWKCPIIQLH